MKISSFTFLLLAWLVPCARSHHDAPDVQPTLRSENGTLSVTLSIGPALYNNTETGLVQKVVGYNGMIGGPTLILHPGDVLELTLVNDLPQEPCNTFVPELFNAYHGVDRTNLHFHGLHIADELNPHAFNIGPGQSYTYTVPIPQGHSGGTFWYHPHVAGSTSLQAGGGAFGMLIIEDLPQDLPQEMNDLPELNLRIQFLNFTYLQDDYSRGTGANNSYVELCQRHCLPEENRPNCAEYFFQNGPDEGEYNRTIAPDGLEYETTLVNGMEMPTIPMYKDQWYRVRLLYVPTRFRTLEPSFPVETGCEAHLIAKDGLYLMEIPRVDVSDGFMVSGQRADFLVRCSTAGMHEFRSNSKARPSTNWIASQKKVSLDRFLAYFDVQEYTGNATSFAEQAGYANPETMPMVKPNRPCYAADLRDIEANQHHNLLLSGLCKYI